MIKQGLRIKKGIFTAISTIAILLTQFQVNADEASTHFCGPTVPKAALKLDSIIPALYGIVSGAAGETKNWQLMSELFAPNGQIVPVFHDKKQQPQIDVLSVEKFVELNKQIFKDINFYETEVSKQIFQVGHMATVLSHYASRDDLNAAPYSQGINSFQLLNDGRRWCVISVTWDSDKGGHAIHAFE
ncbi:hypothetical protein [Neptunicella marina]|uniref:Nuclear transport factor 2 family protein n=1 Tax=Neptunicella marina TaxID=2125989 RepID=A0A8J6IUA6_9ALTE|nr:hypothetical protein [Neptunicella marina]MBC3765583.1 hypothetical protein [Neptunicella marina]